MGTVTDDVLDGVLDAADVAVDPERAMSEIVGESGMSSPETGNLLLVPEGLEVSPFRDRIFYLPQLLVSALVP